MPDTKDYLGDSVYADVDYGSVILTTENDSSGPSNTIFLEPNVLQALKRYIERMIALEQLSERCQL